MQVGSPMELYHEPANLFVAGFLGAPSMNFLDVTVDAVSDSHVTVSSAILKPVQIPHRDRGFSVGQTAVMGVRPQYLMPCDSDASKLGGTVVLTERLGSETVLDINLDDGTKLIAALAEDSIQAPGAQVHFDFDPSQLHVFHPDASQQKAAH